MRGRGTNKIPTSAAICEFQHLFTAAGLNASYNINSGVAGFVYEGSFPELNDYAQSFNASHKFVSISSGAFVALSENPRFAPIMAHPGTPGEGNALGVSHGEVRLSCISQLSITVANSWKGNWTANSPSFQHGVAQ